MTANDLLSRLEKVRESRPHQWMASCPAHEDKTPSLSIRELDDGRVLIHDFAGCEIEEVLSSIGLTFSDLYPDKPLGHQQRPRRRSLNPMDALRVIATETLVIIIAAEDMAAGRTLSEEEHKRLIDAARRIRGIYASLA